MRAGRSGRCCRLVGPVLGQSFPARAGRGGSPVSLQRKPRPRLGRHGLLIKFSVAFFAAAPLARLAAVTLCRRYRGRSLEIRQCMGASSWTWARICSSPWSSLVVGWWVSALLGRWVRRMATRSSKIDPTIVPMFYSTVVWTVRIFTLIAVLARFGVQTASLIAVLGAAWPWAWLAGHAAEHRGGHHAADPASGAHRRVRRPEHRRRGHGRGSRPVPDAPGAGRRYPHHAAQQRGLERHHHQLQPQQDPPPGYPGAGTLWRRPGTGAGQAQEIVAANEFALGSRAAGEGQRVSREWRHRQRARLGRGFEVLGSALGPVPADPEQAGGRRLPGAHSVREIQNPAQSAKSGAA